jgi:hypothetical protein
MERKHTASREMIRMVVAMKIEERRNYGSNAPAL